MKALWFGKHLYQPLLYLEQEIVEISPVPLNKPTFLTLANENLTNFLFVSSCH